LQTTPALKRKCAGIGLGAVARGETKQRGGACAMHKLRLRTGAELDRHSGMSGAAASTNDEVCRRAPEAARSLPHRVDPDAKQKRCN
jgi:hypothetical protein